ncbi:hypothetical protein ACWIGW_38995 [Nocardia brasiliensis]
MIDEEQFLRTGFANVVAALGPTAVTKLPLLVPGLTVGLPGIVAGGAVAVAAASVISGQVSVSGLLRLNGEDWEDLGTAAFWGGASTLGLGLIGRAAAGWNARRLTQGSIYPKIRKEYIAREEHQAMLAWTRWGGFAGYRIHRLIHGGIPTIDIASGRMLPGMPIEFLMPCPPRLSPTVEADYRDTPALAIDCFRSFGSESHSTPPDTASPAPLGEAAQSGIPTYQAVRSRLATDQIELSHANERVAALTQESADIVTRGRKDVADAVVELNTMASTGPPDGRTQDDWTLEYLHAMVDSLHSTMRDTTERVNAVKEQITALLPREPTPASPHG